MNRIEAAFTDGKAFIPFITCGDPNILTTEEIVRRMVKNGANVVELGIPFSDPTAEGEVIQAANERALKAGATTDKIFDMVTRLREDITTPFVFMTYANVVFSYGAEKFFAKCQTTGIDGIILPDLPFEERDEFSEVASRYGITLISMIAPTSKERTEKIAKEAQGFLYIVSSLGVTGVRSEIKTDLSAIVKIIKEHSKVPCAIGFGISTEEQAKKMASVADGVIVGSAIVKLAAKYGTEAPKYIGEYVKKMKEAANADEASKKKVGILGPKGTHSDAAAGFLKQKEDFWLTEYDEIHDCLIAVQKGEVDAALVPVENSLEGSVNITLDILAQSDNLKVARELVWPVHNQLMAKCEAGAIRRIYSHPQPISQCFHYLAKNYPNAEIIKVSSTAKAAQMASKAPKENGTAAICTKLGGELNGLKLIAENVEDNGANCTRFFEVCKSENMTAEKNADKALIICQIDGSRAGSLAEVLNEFSTRAINITRIESRPARTELGAYIFFLDIEIGDNPSVVNEAIEAVRQKSIWLKHMGAFSVLDATK